jgi:hypothetical protein
MRCLPALWLPSNWHFHTFYGGYTAAVIFFALGCIPSAAILAFLFLGYNRVALVMATMGLICAIALVVLWAQDCAYWFSAPLPIDCGRESCDNDGAIRLSLAIGGAILPLSLPLFLTSVYSFIRSLRQIRSITLPLN